ncbi:hypothetical protein N9544_07820 [Flavobacteriales bacterium]|nr:hypothetical protein [Flavobacteriales bacterium]
MRKITRFCMVLLAMVMTNNILFGQSELEDFTKSETELRKLKKKELREYVSFLENISDSLLRKKNDNIVWLQSQLKEKKSRIISIENEIEKLKTLQSKLESEKSELQSEKSKLESEKSELENELENLSILVSKNNEELNLLRKLNGIEKDTIQKNHDIKEIGDGSVISVGELTLTPNGYKYQNKPYTGYLWNFQDGNYIRGFRQIRPGIGYNGDETSGLYFGMVKDGVKEGIWVENKNEWTNTLKITKYEKGKINNGFTLEIDWDLSYFLIIEELKFKNFFDSLPDNNQFIEVIENVEEQTDNVTYKFRYEGNKNYVRNKQIQEFYKSLKSQEKIEFTKDLYKILTVKLTQLENPMDLLLLLNGYITWKIDTYNSNHNLYNDHSDEQITFKIDNYKMGKKSGLSIDTKLRTVLLDIPGDRIPDLNRTSNEDVNNQERWTYKWDVDVSNYKNGELDSVSVKGKYTYIKDGINRGIVNFNEIQKSKNRYIYHKGDGVPRYDKIPKNIILEDPNLRVTRTFEETSPNKTDITFFTSKPEFISISETDEYQLENYKQGKKDGVQTYYEKGVLTLKEEYSKGELNGDKEVYKKGIIQSVETFSNGVLTLKKIYENGIIKEEHYCRGVKDSNGYIEKFILKRVIYVNGNLNETWYYKKDIGFSDYYIQDKDNTSKITKH